MIPFVPPPFHMMQFQEIARPCVYDLDDNKKTHYFYPICSYVHDEPPMIFNGVEVWMETPQSFTPRRRLLDDYDDYF
jgi:hypothetical protein